MPLHLQIEAPKAIVRTSDMACSTTQLFQHFCHCSRRALAIIGVGHQQFPLPIAVGLRVEDKARLVLVEDAVELLDDHEIVDMWC